jgi:hopanoid biosynthesis associated RND transporter like protein HpnN
VDLLTGRVLRSVVRLCTGRPALTLGLALTLAGVSLVYTARSLTFQTSMLALLPSGQRYVTLFNEYLQDFGELNDSVVAVEARSVDEAKAYAARLADELGRAPVHVPRATYRVDPAHFEERLLLYLPVPKLQEIGTRLLDNQELLETYVARPSLAVLLKGINQQIAAGFVTHFFDIGLQERQPLSLRFLRDLLAQMASQVAGPPDHTSSVWAGLFGFDERDEGKAGYFLSEDESLLFLLVPPVRREGTFADNREVVGAIRKTIAALRAEFPHVRAGVTGTPALSTDEMTTAFRDSELATPLAFGVTVALLLLAFRQITRPMLMCLVLAVSLAWTMGVITLTVGHLTIFSVMFVSLMVGIGIDYGIYFLFRYQEELALGRNVQAALERTAAYAGPGILVGALAAVGTFGTLALTGFRGVQEFGLVSGVAILLAFVSMITVFPAALALLDRRQGAGAGRRTGRPAQGRLTMAALEWIARTPRTVLVGSGLLAAAGLATSGAVRFDYNMLNLQAERTESVIWEKRILAAGRSGFTALSTADTLDELRRKQAAFERLPTVARVDSVLRLVPSDQAQKIPIIRELAPLAAALRVGRAGAVDVDEIRAALGTLRRRLDIAISESGASGPPAELVAARTELERLETALRGSAARVARERLAAVQTQMSQDFAASFGRFQRGLAASAFTVEDLSPELSRRFVGASGRLLMRIHPRGNPWELDGARSFVGELRSVDPDVTGSPVIRYEATRLMEAAYYQGTIYALVLVALIAGVVLRNLRDTAISLVPVALGMLWMLGAMAIADLRFNLANVFGLPIVIGASAEYGLNVMLRYREEAASGEPRLMGSTLMAVLFNGLTTIAGFGSLMIARHSGIFSLGLLLTIGAVASLIASLVVLPSLITLLQRRTRRAPNPG